MTRREARRVSSHEKTRPDSACLSPPREERGMRPKTVFLIISSMLLLSAVLLAGGCAITRPQGYRSFVTQTPAPANSYLVIGFMGGVEAWDADKHTGGVEVWRGGVGEAYPLADPFVGRC